MEQEQKLQKINCNNQQEKCDFNISNLLEQLEKEGYAIVNNIISEEDCIKYINQFWTYLEELECGFIRNDNSTWAKSMPDNEKGIIKGLGIGHQQFVWDIRQNPKIYDIFSQIWNTQELTVSLDAVNIQFGPEIGGQSEESFIPLYHVDQGVSKLGKMCIQGSVNLEDQGELDGSFACWPKSHFMHEEFFKHFGIKYSSDFFQHKKEHLKWFENQQIFPKKLLIPKGSLVLWDSRLIHAAILPSEKRNDPNKIRYAVYVCMMPKKDVSQMTMKKKVQIFERQSHTNHWANHAVEDEFYYDLEKYKVKKQDVKLTPLGRKLIGLDED